MDYAAFLSELNDLVVPPRSSKPTYLGNVTVAPQSEVKQAIDIELRDPNVAARELSQKIREIIPLPLESPNDSLPGSYFAIDLFVNDYTRGGGSSIFHGDYFLLTLIFRPKFEIVATLRDGETNHVEASTRVTKRMSIFEYLKGSLDIRRLFWVQKRDEETLNRLLLECLIDSISKLRS